MGGVTQGHVRTALASQRTLLAFVRTAMVLVSASVLMSRPAPLIGAALILLLAGLAQHVHVCRSTYADKITGESTILGVSAAAVIIVLVSIRMYIKYRKSVRDSGSNSDADSA